MQLHYSNVITYTVSCIIIIKCFLAIGHDVFSTLLNADKFYVEL